MLDLHTLSFTLALTAGTLALTFAALAAQARQNALATWFTAGLTAHALSFGLIAARDHLPIWASIFVANTSIFIGFIFFAAGCRGLSRSTRSTLETALALVSLLSLAGTNAWYTHVENDVAVRVVVVALLTAACCAVSGAYMLSDAVRRRWSLPRLATAAIYLTTSALLVVHAAQVPPVGDEADLARVDETRVALLTVLAPAIVAIALGAIWIILGDQAADAQEKVAALDRANALLDKERSALRRTNASLEEFAGIASHDLRSPLRGIGTLTGLIRDEAWSEMGEPARGHLQQIESRTMQLDALVTGLLSYAAIYRADEPGQDIDVAKAAEAAIGILDRPQGLAIRYVGETVRLRSHRVAFETVLRNLIDNAIKHHDDPRNGSITVHARHIVGPAGGHAGGHVEVVVEDDGPGISAEHRKRSEKALRNLTTSPSGKLSGLGLSVVRRYVEAYHGELRLEQRRGRGARIVFTWSDETPGTASRPKGKRPMVRAEGVEPPTPAV